MAGSAGRSRHWRGLAVMTFVLLLYLYALSIAVKEANKN